MSVLEADQATVVAGGEDAPLRIAYVINSMEGGGAQLVIPAVAASLRKHGAEVRVFALTRRDGRAIAPVVDSGFEVEVRDGGDNDQCRGVQPR